MQAGVAYIGGYQGSPISHLMDVFADADPLLRELGVHFESSASEATAAAMLAASVNYPLRGAVAWKSVVGTNVASDALSNVASGGVKGGALIIVGEDYGEGSSIMQERTHAFAMKSQMWLLDPLPNLTSIVNMVEKGFELSEASNTPVFAPTRCCASPNICTRACAKCAKRYPPRSAARSCAASCLAVCSRHSSRTGGMSRRRDCWFITLRLAAGLRHFRRASLRYAEEQARIEGWLEAIWSAATRDVAFATELARNHRLIKG